VYFVREVYLIFFLSVYHLLILNIWRSVWWSQISAQVPGLPALTICHVVLLGHGQCHLGEYDQARTQIEQSLTLFEETGEDERIALWFLGQALLALEEYAESQR